jgi:hypothetical protein
MGTLVTWKNIPLSQGIFFHVNKIRQKTYLQHGKKLLKIFLHVDEILLIDHAHHSLLTLTRS